MNMHIDALLHKSIIQTPVALTEMVHNRKVSTFSSLLFIWKYTQGFDKPSSTGPYVEEFVQYVYVTHIIVDNGS